MIKVTVELWPHGIAARKRTLATADIWNDATGTPWLGSYGLKLFSESGRIMRKGCCGEFRRANFGVWWLISACLQLAFPNTEKAFRDNRIAGRLSLSNYQENPTDTTVVKKGD